MRRAGVNTGATSIKALRNVSVCPWKIGDIVARLDDTELEARVEEGHETSVSMLETGVEARRLAAVFLKMEDPDAILGSRQLIQTSARSVGRAVIDGDQLPAPTHLIEGRPHPLDQRFQIADFVVHRDHYGNVWGGSSLAHHELQSTPPCHNQGRHVNTTECRPVSSHQGWNW